MKKTELVDRIRYLVADTNAKLEGEAPDLGVDMPTEPDRQYLLEDLMGRLVSLAREVDGLTFLGSVQETAPAYDLIDRPYLGAMTTEALEEKTR